MARDRIIASEPQSPAEETFNLTLRPQRLGEYVGQPRLVEKLSIALEAARGRNEPLEHVLLHGPPGLGKTTLAHIIANELGSHLTVTAGPALTKPGDLVGVLTKLQRRDVLFVDEIHRLPISLEEYLYAAMEDYKIDVQIDSGMHARTVTLPLEPFTLIGATTRAGLISGPMRSRFGLAHNIEFYSQADLHTILRRSADLLEIPASQKRDEALGHVADRSRGTPRIANRLLRRVRDFASVKGDGSIDKATVEKALELEGVDALGLDSLDRRYLQTIAQVYEGGPVGLEAIAATLAEDARTLDEVAEPYLLQIGFLARTRRGRQLTKAACEHLGVAYRQPEPGSADDPPQDGNDLSDNDDASMHLF